MRLRVSEIVGPLRGTGREADALFSFIDRQKIEFEGVGSAAFNGYSKG